MTSSHRERRVRGAGPSATRRRLLTGAAALAGAGALGGSRAGARRAQDSTVAYPTGADELVLGVKTEGGLVPPLSALVQMPEFSLFGDGLVVTLGPTTLQFPGAALPNLRARRMDEAGIQAVLTEAKTAGLLGEDVFLRTDQIADAGTTTFTATANGKTTVVSAYALGAEVPPGVTGSVADLYRRLAEFRTLLDTLPEWLPNGAIGEADTPYEIDRLQVVAIPTDSLQVPLEPAGEPAVWPLETALGAIGLPFAETDAGLGGLPEFGEARCAVFADAAAATLVAALDDANAQTAWESEGTTYALFPRPLLPHESGCGAPITGGGTPAATPEG